MTVCVNLTNDGDPTIRPGSNVSQLRPDFVVPRQEWLPSALHGYTRNEETLRIARLIHAVAMGLLSVSFMNLLFLYRHSPSHQEFLLSLSLFVFIPSLVMAPFTWMAKRHFFQKRNAIAKRFFSVGLTVDQEGRLVTHEPHAKVVLDQRKFAPDLALADIAAVKNSA